MDCVTHNGMRNNGRHPEPLTMMFSGQLQSELQPGGMPEGLSVAGPSSLLPLPGLLFSIIAFKWSYSRPS